MKNSFMPQEHGLTWHSEGQAIIRVAGFGGDKEVTKDTHCDEEGEQDHGCNGQTNQSAEAGGQEGRDGNEREGKGIREKDKLASMKRKKWGVRVGEGVVGSRK